MRGYRDFVAGRQVAFASAEIRMPFLPSLNTTILGFLRLGQTSFAMFGDAGYVGNITVSESDFGNFEFRMGLGGEINNIVGIGPLRLVHSLGIAQPYDGLFNGGYDFYYRLRTSVPF